MSRYDPADPFDWIIEVCCICGAQLDRYSIRRDGRCIDEAHHSAGGMVMRVQAKPLEEQDDIVKSRSRYSRRLLQLWLDRKP